MKVRKSIRVISLLLLTALIAYVMFFHKDKITQENIQLELATLGIYAPVVFIGLYAAVTVLLLPGSVMTIIGGFLFGAVWGSVYNIIGATLGALVAFLLARTLLSDWVEQNVEGKLRSLKMGVEEEGWKFVAAVRLMPVLPFNILNYALGVTKISVISYTLTSFFFMLPGCIIYTYIGALGQDAAAGEVKDLSDKIFIAVGLLVALWLLPKLVSKWRSY